MALTEKKLYELHCKLHLDRNENTFKYLEKRLIIMEINLIEKMLYKLINLEDSI
jgi:hypothetical protein